MKVILTWAILLSALGIQRDFYGRIFEMKAGELWRIRTEAEIVGDSACDPVCGESCFRSPPDSSLESCFQSCGCAQLLIPPVSSPSESIPAPSCNTQCALVCIGEGPSCVSSCRASFCVAEPSDSEENPSVLLPVLVDFLILIAVLSLFYLVYTYTPKKSKRAKYWQQKIIETQYTRLEDDY